MVNCTVRLVYDGFCILPYIIDDFCKSKPIKFFKAIAPAQLLLFYQFELHSPITMECVTDNLGVDEEVSSFVLPWVLL
jgi:Na+/H+-dicarboxylate symporter